VFDHFHFLRFALHSLAHSLCTHTFAHMNTTTAAQSESATDEEEPSTGLSSSESEDSESSLGVQRELWNRGLASSDEEEDVEPALQSTATSAVATASGAVATASGAVATAHVPHRLLCDICQQVRP
jgi:hypothetical protein